MPKGAKAASIRTRASSTWTPTASMPPSSIPVSACSRAPSRTRALPPRCAAPTTAGWPITASRIPSASSGSRCCRCSRSSWRSTRCATPAKRSGCAAGSCGPNRYHGKKIISDPMYEPFWTMAEDLDFSIGFHEGSTNAMPTVGVDRFEDDRAARHIVSHTMEMMLVALSVIWSGIVDRHPRLRVAFLESGGGWIAPWLDRMDRHFDDQGFNDSGLTTRPSELFQRNCWISFEPVEGSLDVLADYIGPEKILWATDYPHGDGFFPGAPALISKRTALSEATKLGVLAGGAMKFYGLK